MYLKISYMPELNSLFFGFEFVFLHESIDLWPKKKKSLKQI